VEETHAEGVLDCDKVPVGQGVALADAQGDRVPDEDRQADAVPQGVGEANIERELVPE